MNHRSLGEIVFLKQRAELFVANDRRDVKSHDVAPVQEGRGKNNYQVFVVIHLLQG